MHFKENWDNRRVPAINFDKDKAAASLQRIADVLVKEKAQLWINHDKAQRDSLRISPEYFESARCLLAHRFTCCDAAPITDRAMTALAL